jgi:membrane-associated phospholipid phosphatase
MMKHSSKSNVFEVWGRITLWLSQHWAITKLVSLTTGLIVFLALLPPYMRIVFWNGLQSHKILAGMLLVFGLLAISLVWSTGQHVDAWAFLLLNVRGKRPIWLDRIMLGYTQLGSGIAALGITLVLYVVNERLLSYKFILGTVALWLVVELLKFLVHRSRPFMRVTQARIVGYRAIGQSFPSGHTSQAFFMATLITQHFHSSVWVVFLMYAAALLVGMTRMYVGAHYPRDVLAGAILGSVWGWLGMMIDGYVFNGTT